MKKFTLFIMLFLFAISTVSYSYSSEGIRDLYVIVINLQDEIFKDNAKNYFIEVAKSKGFVVPEEGLYLGKIEDFPEKTLYLCRIDFLRETDSQTPSKQLSGMIQGNLCNNAIGKQSFFPVLDRESIQTLNITDYSRDSLEKLRFEIDAMLTKLKTHGKGDLQPLFYVHVL